MDDKQENLQTYNKNAVGFAKKFDEIEVRKNHIEKGFSFIKKENPKVVELGCANGRDAKEILKHTNDYLGIDYSKELIRLARENVAGGRLEVADFLDFEFPKEIDVIFAFASLLHLNKDEIKFILNKCHESLDNNGIFYIALKYGKYERAEKIDELGKRIFYFYTPSDIKELIGDKYKILEEEREMRRGQEWFNIILQKK